MPCGASLRACAQGRASRLSAPPVAAGARPRSRSTVPNSTSSVGGFHCAIRRGVCASIGKSEPAVSSCAIDRRHCSHVRSGGHPATPVDADVAASRWASRPACHALWRKPRACAQGQASRLSAPPVAAGARPRSRSTVPNSTSSVGGFHCAIRRGVCASIGKSEPAVSSCAIDRRHCSHVRSGGHPATPVDADVAASRWGRRPACLSTAGGSYSSCALARVAGQVALGDRAGSLGARSSDGRRRPARCASRPSQPKGASGSRRRDQARSGRELRPLVAGARRAPT